MVIDCSRRYEPIDKLAWRLCCEFEAGRAFSMKVAAERQPWWSCVQSHWAMHSPDPSFLRPTPLGMCVDGRHKQLQPASGIDLPMLAPDFRSTTMPVSDCLHRQAARAKLYTNLPVDCGALDVVNVLRRHYVKPHGRY